MDTYLKRIGAFHPLVPFGPVLPAADGAAADRKGEREALISLYPVDDTSAVTPPPPVLVQFTCTVMIVQPAHLTGILQIIPRVSVRPTPLTRTTQVSWAELVRQAEGPEFASRGRYQAYTFGNGRRRRNFYGNTDGT